MALHDALIAELHSQIDRLLDRYDDLRRYLVGAESLTRENPAKWGFASREARGAAVVGAMAELEASTRIFIQLTHRELNQAAIPVKGIRSSLRALAAHAELESLRHTGDNSTLWTRKAYATTLDTCSELTKFPIMRKTSQPPLDGKTLKPPHFHHLWQVYGLPGVPFPAVSWEGSLLKIALARNDIAHGNSHFREIFLQPGREAADIERYLNDLSLFAIHLVAEWEVYLTRRLYLAFP